MSNPLPTAFFKIAFLRKSESYPSFDKVPPEQDTDVFIATPGVWSDKDLDHILGRYGAFVVERTGTDIDEALTNLQPWKDNIYVIAVSHYGLAA